MRHRVKPISEFPGTVHDASLMHPTKSYAPYGLDPDFTQANRGPFGVGSSGPCIDCVWLGGLRLCSIAIC